MNDHMESVLFDESTILRRLDEMGATITRDYAGRELTVLVVLHGSLLFAADLMRRIDLPVKVACLSVSSYHGGTESSGTITFHQPEMPRMKGEDVLVVDDILDSGRTLAAITGRLRNECEPASVKVCVLLDKKTARAQEVRPDYVAFEIADEFVVGYGLDYGGLYRNLPFVGTLKGEHILATGDKEEALR
jgi:hypoxanthine phosphoribosyltransferase